MIAVGFAFGAIDPVGLVSETNTQVLGRTNPRLIDLIAFGQPPEVDPSALRDELDAAGIDLDLVVSLVVGGQRELPAHGGSGAG